jgi:Uma2 family endonuclease
LTENREGHVATGARTRLHRFSIDDYEAMEESGLITRADRVVLLDGLLVKKMTEGPRHATVKHRVYRALEGVLPPGWHARMESPVRLPSPVNRQSEPEPDVAVVRGEINTYEQRHPGPEDAALVVEVARRSLAVDRKGMARYAYHGIPVAWLVNLRNDTVEVYTGPSGPSKKPGYADTEVKRRGDQLEVMLGGARHGRIGVDAFFG